jgi:hypothetical protein
LPKYALPVFAAVAAAMALSAAGGGPPGNETVPATNDPPVVEEATPDRSFAGGPPCPACGRRNPPGADYCIFCGTKLEQRAKKRVPQADPTPPWLGPGGWFSWDHRAVGLAGSYGRRRFEVRGGGRYYLPLNDYDAYGYSVGAAFRLYIVTSRQRPFVEIKSDYKYEEYYIYGGRRGVTGSVSELYPGVALGLAYNYGRRGSSVAGAAGYTASVELPSGHVYNRYPFFVENITFVNDRLGLWVRGDLPIFYYGTFYGISGGVAFAF